jgi:2',3'-cyclic-nucleotide 2'-phosphodiesterase (5'-nucleotidase family)
LTYSYDAAHPAGSRIVAVTVGGKPLELGRTYRLATNDYLYAGGDGYDTLSKGKPIVDAAGGTLMATIVMDYISARREIAPKVDGRITRLN